LWLDKSYVLNNKIAKKEFKIFYQ